MSMLRNATMEDIKQIHKLLAHYADKGLLLGRSLNSLYDQLRDFKVVIAGPEDIAKGQEEYLDRVIGAGALHICWENLAEIRSLAVADDFQGRGLGKELVEAFIGEAQAFGINQVFTLTYQPKFFKKMGFRDIDKGELPHKVWSDCLHCPKFPDCNEEALIWEK